MSNCPKCGLLIGHGTVGTVTPLCQCGWQQPFNMPVARPSDLLADVLRLEAALSASQAREAELQKKLAAEQESMKAAESLTSDSAKHWWKLCGEVTSQLADTRIELAKVEQRAEAAEAIIKASRDQARRIEELERKQKMLIEAAQRAWQCINIVWVSHHANLCDSAMEELTQAVEATPSQTVDQVLRWHVEWMRELPAGYIRKDLYQNLLDYGFCHAELSNIPAPSSTHVRLVAIPQLPKESKE